MLQVVTYNRLKFESQRNKIDAFFRRVGNFVQNLAPKMICFERRELRNFRSLEISKLESREKGEPFFIIDKLSTGAV